MKLTYSKEIKEIIASIRTNEESIGDFILMMNSGIDPVMRADIIDKINFIESQNDRFINLLKVFKKRFQRRIRA